MNIRFIRRKENIFNPDTIVEDGEKFANFEGVRYLEVSYLSEKNTQLELFTLTLENGVIIYVDATEWQLLMVEGHSQVHCKGKTLSGENEEVESHEN